jgi:hypothetical protein
MRQWMYRLLKFVAWCAVLSSACAVAAAQSTESTATLPPLHCQPIQTGGFHDYPEGEEVYEPALFHARSFDLEVNLLFMLNLQPEPGSPDLYLTMRRTTEKAEAADAFEHTELECRGVRGIGNVKGFSCVNVPPSELLLINAETLRFTRAAVGGWTFAGAAGDLNGDSIFIEYGACDSAAADSAAADKGAAATKTEAAPGLPE